MRLEPVSASDVDWLPDALGEWSCSLRWSEEWGRTPSPDDLSRLLWHNVFFQRVVLAEGDRRVALLQASELRLVDGVADLDVLIDPAHQGESDKCLEQFLARVFSDQPLRKLCLAVCSDDLELSPCLGAVVRQAGCFVEHRRRERGRFVDINLYEIWADDDGS